ncbi:MAG: FAD-dependent thymidylate synthase [Clostridiales bacterium]|jgi:thymidylate synthase (FAD)|nr:FAD-dependent thymidylate synthase [Clostridiales bacterium]
MPSVEQKVEIIACTPCPEALVATAARLCYSASSVADLHDKTTKKDQSDFINRLTQMGHASTFEHAGFTFAIEGVSRALLAQITRHRIASFSVQSQRYVNQNREGESIRYVIPPSIRALGEKAVEEYASQMRQMTRWYGEWVRALGAKGESANEDARFVLPNACETRMIVTMNVRELLHFFALRCCNRAQWEIRALAWRMLELCLDKAPNLFASAGPACVRGACPEGKMSCGRMDEVRENHARIKER